MTTQAISVEGGCTCRAVRYRMTAPPLIVHCCHCRWCQRETGASFALNALVEADRVQLLQGAPEAIMKTCQEIDRLEADADRVMRAAMLRLFREESDVKQLIKLRSIYEQLELVTDRCEDVANIVEGIVLEHS